MNTPERLIIALHDVAPATWESCRRITDELEKTGACPYALFVVPCFHGAEPLTTNGEFVAWLAEKERSGNEIVLHGYSHLVGRRRARGLDRVRGALLSNREDEFLHFDREAFGARIRAGRRILNAAGFQPAGFVAPAWLMPRFGVDAVRECGFAYTETLTRLFLLRRGISRWSPCVVFSSRTRRRLATSVVWNGLLTALFARAELLRVAIHPGDVPAALPAILGHIARQRNHRRCCGYGAIAGVA